MNGINNTLFIGKVLHFLEETTSTNTVALEMLAKGGSNAFFTEGGVIFTFNQTAGRGQYGNRWDSEKGENIAMSIILKPHFLQARQQFHLNKAIALAVHDVFTVYTEGVSVKWANDIFIKNKKVAGILIQNTLSGTRIESSVIGIGINVNQTNFKELPNATSLKLETHKMFDLFKIVEHICQSLEKRYLQLKSGHFEKLDAEYLSKLYRFNEIALFQYPNGAYFQGKIVGISEVGKLVVETKLGLENFDIQGIKFVL